MPSQFETAQSLRIDIDELVATASKALVSPSSLGTYSTKTVRQLVTPLLNQHKGLKPALTVFFNAFASLTSELEESSITPSAAVSEFKKIQKALVEAEASYVATLGGYESQQEDNMASLLTKNQQVRTRLQSEITKKPLLMTTAPILPMVSLDHAKLARAGIRSQNLQGYASLEVQRVVGISYDYVTKRLEHTVAQAKELARDDKALFKKQPKNERELEKLFDVALNSLTMTERDTMKLLRTKDKLVNEIFQDVLDTFLAKNPGYEVIGSPLSWWRARWYWVMPRAELAHLRNCAYGGKFNVDKWDFTFAARSTSN